MWFLIGLLVGASLTAGAGHEVATSTPSDLPWWAWPIILAWSIAVTFGILWPMSGPIRAAAEQARAASRNERRAIADYLEREKAGLTP